MLIWLARSYSSSVPVTISILKIALYVEYIFKKLGDNNLQS